MENEMISTALQKFNVTDAAIAKIKEEYLCLVVTDLTDRKQIEKVHEARMDVKGKRIEVEKTRKELKEDALRYGQAIDKEAKRITALLTPIEEHLNTEDGKVQAEKDRIKTEAEAKEAERLQARINTLNTFGATFNGQNYISYGFQIPVALLKVCTDEQFTTFIAKVQEAKDADDVRIKAEEEARKAEAARLAKIAAEQEAERARLEAIRKEQEAAAAKIKAEQEAIDAEKKRIADAEAKRAKDIEDEKKRVEEEKRRAEELEKARKEAAEKALRDAEAKRLKDEADRIEKERLVKIAAEKKAARLPDKQKLFSLAHQFEITFPAMKTEEGQTILADFRDDLAKAINRLNERAEAL